MSFYDSPLKKPIGNNYLRVENYKELENELKIKSLYLAKSAHELKNVFLTITSFIESNGNSFNLENTKKDDKNNNLPNIDFLKSLCDFGMSIVYEITQMGKNEGNFKSMKTNVIDSYNLYDCLNFCFQMFNSRAKFEKKTFQIKYDYKISKETTIKSISEMRLKQVVINLLSNSFKFTVKGNIILSVEKVKEKIRIKVSDTGIGFDVKDNKKLFCPYEIVEKNEYLNKNGSGLGLYICKEILETNKSKINCISEKGKGTEFYFDLIAEEDIINPSFLLNDNLRNIIFSINQGIFNNNQDIKNNIIKNEEENKIEIKSNVDDLSSYNFNYDIFRKVQTLNGTNKLSKNTLQFPSITENPSSSSILKSRNSKKNNLTLTKTLISIGIEGNFNRSFSECNLDRFKKDFFRNKCNNIRCLICDDDNYAALAIRKLILKFFEKDKNNIPDIYYVQNGIECLHIVYTNLLHNNPIDIIIMDQNMPFLNGFYTCKVLKNIQEMNNVKIFLQSSELININECRANGFYDKPLSMNAIRDIFKKK